MNEDTLEGIGNYLTIENKNDSTPDIHVYGSSAFRATVVHMGNLLTTFALLDNVKGEKFDC